MTGDTRRGEILKELSNSEETIPARKLAELFNVSRQVIVGDIALLRAEGHPIIATNRGYLVKKVVEGLLEKYIAMDHRKEETRVELEIFVKHGVIVESVTVEHPVYGEITGQLNIKTKEDIDDFLKLKPELLSTLTHGVHIHKIICPDEATYVAVKEDLIRKELVYQND